MSIRINGNASGEVYVPYGQTVTLSLSDSTASLAQAWSILPPTYDDGTAPDRATNWPAWSANPDGSFQQNLSTAPWTPTGGKPDVPDSWLIRCVETTAGGPVTHTAVMRVRNAQTGEAAPAPGENTEASSLRGWWGVERKNKKAAAERKGQIRVYNNTGSSITDKWCRISGAVDFRTVNGNANPGGSASKADYVDTVAVASSTDPQVFEETLVKVEGTIANGAFGWARASGKVAGNYSGYSAGDAVYLGSAGAETSTPGPIRLGVVKVATSTGFLNARPKRTPVKTLADLLSIIGTRPDQDITVNGSLAAGDGGEGRFIWTTDTLAIHDDGMVIVPTVGGWTRTGCWKRVIGNGRGSIKAAWFGCRANYTGALAAFDQAPAIQKAIGAATYQNKTESVTSYYVGGSAVNVVELPPGQVFFNQPVFVPPGITIHGNNTTLSTMMAEGQGYFFQAQPNTTFRNLFFSAYTKNCVRVFGPIDYTTGTGLIFRNTTAAATPGPFTTGFLGDGSQPGQIRFEGCVFRDMQGPAIYVDHSNAATNRSTQCHITITDFDFSGAKFFYGVADRVTLSRGYLRWWNQNRDDLYKNLNSPCFMAPILHMDHAFVVAQTTEVASNPPTTGIPTAAFCAAGGPATVQLNNVRLGEDFNCILDCRHDTLDDIDPYIGPIMRTEYTGTGPSLIMDQCSSGWNFDICRVYDSAAFPFKVIVSNPDSAYFASGSPLKIWIPTDSEGDAIMAADWGRENTLFDASAGTYPKGQWQFRRAPIPTWRGLTGDGTAYDVTSLFAHVIKDQESYAPAWNKNNLLPAGVEDYTDSSQQSYSFAGDTGFSAAVDGTFDTQLGYTIPRVAKNAKAGYLLWQTTNGWPSSAMPAGEYTLSFFIRSADKGNVNAILYAGRTFTTLRHLKTVKVGSNGNGWSRISATFSYSGSGTLGFQLLMSVDPRSGTFYYPALPMINRGREPAPWVPATGLSATSTAEDHVGVVLYGTTPPTAGLHKKGTIMRSTDPASTGCRGWVCISGGTPGTWEAFGLLNGIVTYTTTPAAPTIATATAVVNLSSAGASTVTLPTTGLFAGYALTVVDGKGDAGFNNITVNAPGGHTINGASSFVIRSNYESVTFQYVGSSKWICK